ncbi:MAG TPA: TetR/AcrR family transcriptional regulator [Defluviitaleaceae bacterium]|nr:TetR/AcrR family transcriptional regulator [Defluviitaleaceae bacterium]
MRVAKTADERRHEILDAAEKLFSTKGFDATSTNDILEEVGIARGTLYYHFKSKEAIMDALIERYNTKVLNIAKKIANDKSISVFERMMGVVMALNINNKSEKEIIEHIHKPQNALMHQKVQRVILTEVTPILAEIIEDGIKEGVFNTPYPYESVEMLIAYTNTVFDTELIEMTIEEKARRIEAFIFNLERLLGAKRGSLISILQVFGEGEKDGK